MYSRDYWNILVCSHLEVGGGEAQNMVGGRHHGDRQLCQGCSSSQVEQDIYILCVIQANSPQGVHGRTCHARIPRSSPYGHSHCGHDWYITATVIDKHQEETLDEFLSNFEMEMNSEERDSFFINKLFSLCEYRHNTAFYYREKWIFWIIHRMSREEEATKEAEKV